MVTRIRKLLEEKQLTPTQFADLIGVGRPVMSHILSERNKPSLEVVQRIISAFPELSLPWLLSGTGDMLTANAVAPISVPQGASPLVAAPPPTPQPRSSSPGMPPADETAAPVPQPLANATKEPATMVQPELFKAPQLPVPSAMAGAARTEQVADTPNIGATPASQPILPAPKPFRAARTAPPTTEPVPALVASTPAPAKAIDQATAVAVAPTSPASPTVAVPAAPEAAALSFLAEPGKAIRRIVIFYRDGSFADYQPEQ